MIQASTSMGRKNTGSHYIFYLPCYPVGKTMDGLSRHTKEHALGTPGDLRRRLEFLEERPLHDLLELTSP